MCGSKITSTVCRCRVSAESSGGESCLWWRRGGQGDEGRRAEQPVGGEEAHEPTAQLWQRVSYHLTHIRHHFVQVFLFQISHVTFFVLPDVRTKWSTRCSLRVTCLIKISSELLRTAGGAAAGRDKTKSYQTEAEALKKKRWEREMMMKNLVKFNGFVLQSSGGIVSY